MSQLKDFETFFFFFISRKARGVRNVISIRNCLCVNLSKLELPQIGSSPLLGLQVSEQVYLACFHKTTDGKKKVYVHTGIF